MNRRTADPVHRTRREKKTCGGGVKGCEDNKYEQLIRQMTKGERRKTCKEHEVEKQNKVFKNSTNEA
jgi:hypothetical protein